MVIPTEVEIFYQEFCAKALVLVIPTEVEMFYQHLCAKALVLVIPKEAEMLADTSAERLSTVSSPFMVNSFLDSVVVGEALTRDPAQTNKKRSEQKQLIQSTWYIL